MSEEPENIVLQHLRRFDQRLERMESDTQSIKHRIGHIETNIAGLRTDIALLHTITAEISHRFDSFDVRLSRIEKRLDLVDA